MRKLTSSVLCAIVTMVASNLAIAAKPVMGVAEFKNETRAHWWRSGVGSELSSMLSNELASNGSFKIVERAKIGHVLKEQDLAAAGRIKKGTGAKMGEITGAQYTVLGTVSAYEERTASTGGGFSFKGISLGGKKSEAYIAIDLRVVDSSTSELAFVRTVEARSSGSGIRVGLFRGGFGGNLASEKKTPAGKAIRAVIVEIVDYLECAMVTKGSCIDEFQAKEQKRKKSLKDKIKLD